MIGEVHQLLASAANSMFLLIETNGSRMWHMTAVSSDLEHKGRPTPRMPTTIKTDHERGEIVLSRRNGGTRRVSLQGVTVGGDAAPPTPKSGTVELRQQRASTDRRVPTDATMTFMDEKG